MAGRFSVVVLFLGLVGCSAGKSEPESLGKAVNDAYKENDRLTGEIDRLKTQIAELQRSQSVLTEEKEQLRSRMDASAQKIQESERKAKMVTDRNAELAQKIENLTKENQDLVKEKELLKETLKGLVAPAEKKKTQGSGPLSP
jgi:chromosome segregation ATPase